MNRVDNNKKTKTFEMLQNDYEELERKHFKTVYWFWLGILVYFFLIVIGLLVMFCCTESQGLIKYIGLVATLLSIVLSIFAIMFTYTANQQMSDKYKEISSAANDIRLTSSITREELVSVRMRMEGLEARINQMQQTGTTTTQNADASQKQYAVNNDINVGKNIEEAKVEEE